MTATTEDRGGYDVESYLDLHYSKLLAPDEIIIVALAEFHAAVPLGGHMVEIGAGPNLYPLLAAGPYRERIHVTDISPTALRYLRETITDGARQSIWRPFLDILEQSPIWASSREGLDQRLRANCTFQECSVFDLPDNRYDVASSHFVVEALSDQRSRVEQACRKVISCLRPGGHFAVSVMLDSSGYTLDGVVTYRTVPLSAEDVVALFSEGSSNLDALLLDQPEHIIREGHSGMMLVTGQRKIASPSQGA